MLSQTAEYALRAVLHLARHEGEGPVRGDDVARALDVPRNYLSKILHALARDGILTSTRGPGGGFELAVRAGTLSLERVVGAFDDLAREGRCLLGHTVCSDATACGAHRRWKEVRGNVRAFFHETTVADLVANGARAAPPAARTEPPRAARLPAAALHVPTREDA